MPDIDFDLPAGNQLLSHYFRAAKTKAELEKQLADCVDLMADIGKQLNRMEIPGFEQTRMSPLWISRCEDCDKITPQAELGHMFGYLVTDEVWKEVASPELRIMLCLHCLRKRSGRAMTLADFPKHKLNTDENYKSYLVEYANNAELQDEAL